MEAPESQSRCVIIVAAHKACDILAQDCYLPVFVGSTGKTDIGFIRDDTGDNISQKNPLYCELTGLYWAWKNIHSDYLGLSHYRRYFASGTRRPLSADECTALVGKYDIILPRKSKYYIETIYSHYANTFSAHHLNVARTVIEELYPAYLEAYDRVMKRRSGHMYNMFIMRRDLADGYCEWLFHILFELEKRIDISNMTPFEARYIGRVSERLLNVWIERHRHCERLKTRELRVVYSGKVDWYGKVSAFLKAKYLHKGYSKSF